MAERKSEISTQTQKAFALKYSLGSSYCHQSHLSRFAITRNAWNSKRQQSGPFWGSSDPIWHRNCDRWQLEIGW